MDEVRRQVAAQQAGEGVRHRSTGGAVLRALQHPVRRVRPDVSPRTPSAQRVG